MIDEDLVKYIKRNKRVQISKMDTFKIGFNDIERICKMFDWTVSETEKDFLHFLDRDGNVITDFSKYDLKPSKYKAITVLFSCQEDCDKFAETFTAIKGQKVSDMTASVTMESLTDGIVENTRRNISDGVARNSGPQNIKFITHSRKTWEQFDNWRSMPEFYFNFKTDIYVKIPMYFNKEVYTNEVLAKLFSQNIHKKTDSLWFPKKEKNEFNYYRVLGGNEDPKYPIYIVSKGRANVYRMHTSQSLTKMQIKHYVCVEPQEFEAYQASEINKSPYCTIIPMDLKYKEMYNTLGDLGNAKATGAGAARNFCADDARSKGFHRCWILDDNTEEFFRVWRGRRIIAYTPDMFRCIEKFMDRYTNIGIAGMNYHMFVINQDPRPPFTMNTKIYSYVLWNLDCPYVAQEGRYNEDVIQSLNILTHGWCTAQFNLYIARKLRTQVLKGGNTTEIYKEEYGGTFAKSQMLAERYPEYTSLVWKFRRWHHEVDYTKFRQTLIPTEETKKLLEKDYNQIDENGAYIVKIDPKYHLDQRYDNREFLEKIYPRGCPEDITHDLMYLPDDRNNIEIRNFWDFETPGKCKVERLFRNEIDESKPKEILDSPLFDEKIEPPPPPKVTGPKKPTGLDALPTDVSVSDKISLLNSSVEGERIFNEQFSIDIL